MFSEASFLADDLIGARTAIAEGHTDAVSAMRQSLAAANSDVCRHVFLELFTDTAEQQARSLDEMRRAGGPLPPLGGLAVSIKALFDVHGRVTTSGSKILADDAPATADCPAVQRLRDAGAALIGHTNQSEFAFSAVGINPHHGTPANPAVPDDGIARIPGGSTSGGAVSVATGAAWAALGSDTGGSLRIPAALQGLVGFKNTARLTPADGSIPLSPSLDTTGMISRSVRDAALLHGIIAARPVRLAQRPVAGWRIGVPDTVMLDALEPAVAAAFEQTLATLRDAGARIESITLPELAEVASINAGGGFAPVEAWTWHRHQLAERESDYDPRVARRIRRGEQMSAAEYIDLQRARRDWIARMEGRLREFDVMLSPTVPIIAPPLAPLLDDDERFFTVNAQLLRNPSVVNLLDGCALSLPCQQPGEAPVGLMVWQRALADETVLAASLAIEARLRGRDVRTGS
ncbi:amidase [Piscinibacter sakaiensis]|uniref:amidase n=1 Tax=Piscinibacter sakaiensis TaxID=1547922 RepID=UPI003AAEE67F